MTLINGMQNYQIVGYLEAKEDINIGSDNHAYIYMQPVSVFPNSVSPSDIPDKIQVYVNNFDSFIFEDREYDSQMNRINAIYEFLEKFLIIVQPYVSYNPSMGRTFFQGKKLVKLLRKNASFNRNDLLLPLPVFGPDNSAFVNNQSDFESYIFENKKLGKLRNPWSSNIEDTPHGIVWKQDEDHFTFYSPITGQAVDNSGNISFSTTSLKKYTINDEWLDLSYELNDVLFMPSSFLKESHNKGDLVSYQPSKTDIAMSEDDRINLGQLLFAQGLFDAAALASVVVPEKPHVNATGTTTLTPVTAVKTPVIKVSSTPSIPATTGINHTEKEFVDRFIEIAWNQRNLFYRQADLVNFHTAMKSDGMVILAGLSGTGKSKLVATYAEALKINQTPASIPQVKFIPVRPFWADDADLLGYADIVNHTYRPGDSGLVDTLIAANQNPDDIYIVVFDEMNLARVEHYFSQFLSVLEMDSDERAITLYNSQLANNLNNSAQYPAQVKIGANVLFVGTVNTDESTYQFSDKVLDRANVITLDMVPFNETDTLSGSTPVKSVTNSYTMADYRAMQNLTPNYALSNAEKGFLWQLHEALNKADKNLGIGWRIVNQINDYLTNIAVDNQYLARTEALDRQIVQRVLTKVKGSQASLKDLVGDETNEGQLIKIFDEYATASPFTKAREVIHCKARELQVYGFTI